MANFINKYLNQSAYDADSTKQYPNTSLVGTDVVFQMSEPTPVEFGGLTVKYSISQEDTQNEVNLFNGGGAPSSGSSESSSESGGGGAMPTTMIVDGVSETPINTWRFETAGEHIVQYEFEDDTVPDSFINQNVNCATEVIVGTDITNIGSGAFNNSYLTIATCLSTTPPSIEDSSVFGGGGAVNYPIYVPAESVNTYKTASVYWEDLVSRIFAIGTSTEPIPTEPSHDSPL